MKQVDEVLEAIRKACTGKVAALEILVRADGRVTLRTLDSNGFTRSRADADLAKGGAYPLPSAVLAGGSLGDGEHCGVETEWCTSVACLCECATCARGRATAESAVAEETRKGGDRA